MLYKAFVITHISTICIVEWNLVRRKKRVSHFQFYAVMPKEKYDSTVYIARECLRKNK
jgi:hypothetical protein